ncbi:uncharacterized protein UV8b_03869 [Ustilaginoidea virens]|uniref:Uncharacterized protein n=1 Tax=Ustilaginoidea virens TaxID=1159556 RepID=A0A8E5HQP3_USTVR|nr:uncharacterized protein UV8b_03869 [Ustilaginoidea virens]QUC19628.1 hypothetical protein UV8b_03869 [Ustilaginoidea virens]
MIQTLGGRGAIQSRHLAASVRQIPEESKNETERYTSLRASQEEPGTRPHTNIKSVVPRAPTASSTKRNR